MAILGTFWPFLKFCFGLEGIEERWAGGVLFEKPEELVIEEEAEEEGRD